MGITLGSPLLLASDMKFFLAITVRVHVGLKVMQWSKGVIASITHETNGAGIEHIEQVHRRGALRELLRYGGGRGKERRLPCKM